ncbi:MAG TPA: cell division protein ZipA C-terminal FtsZ-binding domain-containing protein [Thiobacillaceae bacterium]|nr:cell division protein ZipA C-terminal FtsZ-binding domain-containing protein [Thiobacillaceae bacterium]
MNELQIALAIVGAVAVAGVLGYNRIQERRYRKQAEATFRSMERDVLMDNAVVDAYSPPARASNQRVEPEVRDAQFEHDLSGLDRATGLQEPRFEQGPQTVSGPAAQPIETQPSQMVTVQEAPGPAPSPAPRPAAPAKPVREAAVVSIPPCSPHEQAIEYRIQVKGDGILANVFSDAVAHTRNLSKRVRWMGYAVNGDGWEELRLWSDIHYREIVVSMQLADRNGSVSEQELTALCGLVRDAAAPHGLRVSCDDFDSALERARVLDLFCVDVDVLIGLNVVARGEEALPMHHVRHEAETAGMLLAPDGTYQLQDQRGEILFSLCNHESTPFSPESLDSFSTRGVTLLFDVPRVPDGLKIFDSMVALGRKLAHEVSGLLVDDNLRPLTDSGIERIRHQLAQIYGRMDTRGIPAGSDLALRLFS